MTVLRLWLSRLVASLKSRAATLGGYWGGVTMRWRDKGDG